LTRKGKLSSKGPAPSNSRLSLIYGTGPAEGEAVEVQVKGIWEWADVIMVEPRWRRATRLDGSKGARVRIDDRVVLRLRSTGETIRTTPWLMARSLVYRGVQGALF